MKFIVKMFEILQNQQLQKIISWNPNGSKFLIFQRKQFIEEVLLSKNIVKLDNYIIMVLSKQNQKNILNFIINILLHKGLISKKINLKEYVEIKNFYHTLQKEFYTIFNNQQQLQIQIAECQQLQLKIGLLLPTITILMIHTVDQGQNVQNKNFLIYYLKMVDSDFKTQMINKLQYALKQTQYTNQNNSLINPFIQLKYEIQFQSLEDRVSVNIFREQFAI
ncbi:hypothetical protein pb186bvf_006968 [Paramecium bursaria]